MSDSDARAAPGFLMPPRSVVIARMAATFLSGWANRIKPEDITGAINNAETMLQQIEKKYLVPVPVTLPADPP